MSPPNYQKLSTDEHRDRDTEEVKQDTSAATATTATTASSQSNNSTISNDTTSSAATTTLNNIPSSSQSRVSSESAQQSATDFFGTLSAFVSRISTNIQQSSNTTTTSSADTSSSYQPPTYHQSQALPSISSSSQQQQQQNTASSSSVDQKQSEMMDSNFVNNSNAEVNSLLTTIKNRNWKQTLRSPAVFANPRCFSRPRTSTEAAQRIENNCAYYLTNYLVICALVTIFSILSSPIILILLVVLALVFHWSSTYDTLSIGGYSATGRTKNLVLGGISTVLLFIVAGSTIFSIIGLCSVVISIHALLNDRGGASITDEPEEDSDAAFVNV
jgi:hypothetical protein